MSKKELRSKYKAMRSRLTEDEIDTLSIDIANNMLNLPIWEKSFYHIFLSIQKQKEINTEFVLHILQGKDKNIVVSKSNFDNNTLDHILLTDATVLKTNSWGIPEPVDGIPISENSIDIIFIPLLAYDLKGNRIGYGKGFYDRFLSKCPPEAIKIGLSFFSPEKEIKEVKITDIGLDYCITPTETHVFNQ